MLDQGDKVLVGVSGGPDSGSLTYFERITKGIFLELFVVHLNHMFREKRPREAQYVATLAKEWNIPIKFYGVQALQPRRSFCPRWGIKIRKRIFKKLKEEKALQN